MNDFTQLQDEAVEYTADMQEWLQIMEESWAILKKIAIQTGFTKEIENLGIVFFRMKVRLLERNLAYMQKNKNRTLETSCDPDIIERVAQTQLEIEELKSGIQYYYENGELP
jgi:hypothetical protein